MRRRIAMLSLLAALLLATAGCGSKTSSSTSTTSASPAATAGTHHVLFAKTRFLTDMGLGAYAFYHFVYQRYNNGEFTSGTFKTLAGVYAKAAIALLFAYNRFNAAYKIATTSDDKVLNFLAAPLNKLKNHFDEEHTKLQHGHYSADDLVALNNESQSFYNLTHANGYTITQIPSMIPGAK